MVSLPQAGVGARVVVVLTDRAQVADAKAISDAGNIRTMVRRLSCSLDIGERGREGEKR